MFKKILIANRGEIACRIIRTAKKLNIKTVGIYSDVDKNSLHVKMADESYYVGGNESIDSYLNIENIIKVAIAAEVDAIHPGYGFLSENADFARAALLVKIIFIGPNIEALKIMGSKQLAKQLLAQSKIPLIPGYHETDQDPETLLKAAKKIGFPVLLKAASGGGGKGMRIVEERDDFFRALESAMRQAQSSFKDPTIIIEKYLANPRHVEVQIFADCFGNVVHLFDRDCSIQRRHQKIIEEAPAPNLSPMLRQKMYKASITIAKKINYRGAGTIEFLVDGENFYFMEMNTRLQVEHPVTEAITGCDLVKWQILVAANHPLPLKQSEIKRHGHAIEARIYGEDPLENFLPSIGKITHYKVPRSKHIRIDSGIEQNSIVSRYYDPMLAKLITYSDTREKAIEYMQEALAKFEILGVKTNLAYLTAILEHKKFYDANLSTAFLENVSLQSHIDPQFIGVLATFVQYLTFNNQISELAFWRLNVKTNHVANFEVNNKPFNVVFAGLDANSIKIYANGSEQIFKIKIKGSKLYYQSNQHKDKILFKVNDLQNFNVTFYKDHFTFVVQKPSVSTDSLIDKLEPTLASPMPSTIVAINKKVGDKVKAGDTLVILEAMKMEHEIVAPFDGKIKAIFFKLGDQINEGEKLVELEDNLI